MSDADILRIQADGKQAFVDPADEALFFLRIADHLEQLEKENSELKSRSPVEREEDWRCGEGDNRCNCKTRLVRLPEECAYTEMLRKFREIDPTSNVTLSDAEYLRTFAHDPDGQVPRIADRLEQLEKDAKTWNAKSMVAHNQDLIRENMRLMVDNDRLTKENEELKARLSVR